ncbi:hypothetical protein Tco_0873681 [Tanacetum coccineum]|uniref:Uncharacterized protein n=1 Tax=Tanacetum coccineum TaxID=301880 RepID=A0ABQ5BJK8_9ASTR
MALLWTAPKRMIHTGISYRGGSMLKWSIAGFQNSGAWGSPLESFILGIQIQTDSDGIGTKRAVTGLDLEVFSKAYEERLNEAHAAGSIPVDLSLELQIK